MSKEERIRFGRYELIERLAIGGMAELYRAVLPGPSGFEKIVAIKKILPDLKRSSRFRKMFLHEGRIMAALDHRNLVQVFEMGEVEDELYMCLEYVNGCDLATIIRKNRGEKKFIESYLAAWIAREICQGLDYVHSLTDDKGKSLHIVHRDVNPHNVLLSRMGDVKLGDFGIAKSVVVDVHTRLGQIKGKMEYLSPEQAKGDAVSPSSDLYLVGLLLYEMLASKRYLKGKGDLELMQAAARPSWKPINLYNPRVPEKLESIVQRALRPVPQERYASANSLGLALTEVIESASRIPGPGDLARLVASASRTQAGDQEDTLVTGTGKKPVLEIVEELTVKKPPPKVPRARTVSLPGVLHDSAPKRRRRRKNLVLILCTLSLVALVVAASVYFWPRSKPAPDPEKNLSFPPALTRTDPDLRIEEPVEEPIGEPIGEPVPHETTQESFSAAPEKAEDPAPSPQELPELTDTKVNRREITPKLKTKKQRQNKQRSKKQLIPQNREVEFATKPEIAAGPDLTELQQELKRQRQRLSSRGVRINDVPEIDRLCALAANQITGKQPEEAKKTLKNLDQTIDGLAINRAFIERKMLRLQKALERANLQTRFSGETRTILNHALNSRYTEANTSINRVFDQIRGE